MAEKFCNALLEKNTSEIEKLLTEYMKKTISIRDTFVRRSMKENFYHGILLGILSYKNTWRVSSNQESGEGFSDILIEVGNSDIGIVIEVKYADEDQSLDVSCKEALEQIEARDYGQALEQSGVEHVIKYGIAFQTKKCCVMKI